MQAIGEDYAELFQQRVAHVQEAMAPGTMLKASTARGILSRDAHVVDPEPTTPNEA